MARARTDHADTDARNRLNGIGWSTSILYTSAPCCNHACGLQPLRLFRHYSFTMPQAATGKCFGPQTRYGDIWYAFQHTQARRQSRSRSTAHRRYKCSTSLLVTRCGRTFEQQQQRMHRGRAPNKGCAVGCGMHSVHSSTVTEEVEDRHPCAQTRGADKVWSECDSTCTVRQSRIPWVSNNARHGIQSGGAPAERFTLEV